MNFSFDLKAGENMQHGLQEKTYVLTGTQGTATPARRTLQKGRQEQQVLIQLYVWKAKLLQGKY
jgi:hypothetical protein